MHLLLAIILTLLAFPCVSISQTDLQGACPDIILTGPAGIVAPGQDALFTVDFRHLSGRSEPKLKWSVTGGGIASHPDEKTIKVRFDGKTTVVATVEVLGLPEGCPTTVSEMLSQCYPPVAVALFRLQPDSELLETEANGMADNLKENPSDQLYIQSGYLQGKPSHAIKTKERNVAALFMARGISADRITFVGVFAQKELMRFYRVPPGAENPHCEECEEAERSLLHAKHPSDPAIKFVDTAESKVAVKDSGHPIMLDEFGRMTGKQVRERLDISVSGFNAEPTWIYYFVLYFPHNSSAKSRAAHKKSIRDYLTYKHKIPQQQLVFVSGGARKTQSTQIYFFPPKSPAPIP